MGGEVAVKIACLLASMLNHEYRMYMTIAGSVGTPTVIWYGKEDIYKVIVLEYLGNSISDLIKEQKFDRGKAFLYASQMVHLWYLSKTRSY